MEKRLSVSELRKQYEQQALPKEEPKKKLQSPAHQKAKAKKIFDKFDTDGSGDIDAREFQVLAFELGLTLTDSEAAEFIKEIDTDGNGTIDFEEFYAWWSADKKIDTNSPERAKQLQIMKIKLQSKALLKNAAVLTNTLAKEAEKATKLSDSSINSYDMEFFAGDIDKVNTAIKWTHIVSAEGANELRKQAKAGDQSLVIVVNVLTKEGVDPFELGEIGGSVKAILDLAKGELHYSDFSTGFTTQGKKNLFQLFFTFSTTDLPQLLPINAIVDALKISKFSIEIESTDGIGVETVGFANSRVAIKLDLDRNVLLELANSLPPQQKKGLIGLAALRRAHFSMAFANMSTVLTPDLFPEQFSPDKPHTFKEIRHLFVPHLAELLTNEQLPGQFVELYETCLKLLSGIDSVQIALGSNLFTLQLQGFNIFEGYLPNVEALRGLRAVLTPPPGLQPINVVVATDGGEISGYGVFGVTQPVESLVYSSIKPKNVNMVFVPVEDEPHTLAAVIIRNPKAGFTSPVKTVLVWALPSVAATPDFSQFDKYDNFTKEQFEADTSDTKPIAFIQVPSTDGIQVSLDRWATGKAFFFKLIDAHGNDNIDVEFIGLVGFKAADAPAEQRKLFNTAQTLGITGVPPMKLTDCGVDF